jgi:cobalt-zinc-cadmium resistance protein CzcA
MPVVKTVVCILIFGIAVCLNSAEAQTTTPKSYTLEQAIQRALSDNGYVKSAALQVDYQKKLKGTSWEFEKTDVGYTYGQSNSFVKDNNIELSQTLPSISKSVCRSKLANSYIQIAQLGLTLSQAEIVSSVKETYIGLLYNYSNLKLLLYQDSLYSNFLKAAELKTLKGESPLLEKVTAETRSMEIKTLISQAKSDIIIYQQKLQVMLNEQEPVDIADTALYKIDFVKLPDSSSIANNPSLAIMKQSIEVSKRETQLEKLQLLPDLSIGYFNQSNKDLDNDARFTGVQVGVTIPILFFTQSSQIKAARINDLIAQNNYTYYNTTVKGELQTLLQEFLKLKTSLDYYTNSAIPQADLIIKQAGKGYLSGDIDYVEYVLNLDKALEIKSNYLVTLNDYDLSIISIDKLLGKIN